MNTRTVEQINRELNSLHERLKNVRGTETEVYTRIVGYYRTVKWFNHGKSEEYGDRVSFAVPERLREVSK